MKSLLAIGCVIGVLAATAALRAQPPPLTELLRRASAYLTDYERQISLVVAEEQYTQMNRGLGVSTFERRVLKSDVLVVDAGTAGWLGFRDVFEVDGSPVRDHQNRLLALVTSPVPDALAQAKRMADEGARFNLGGITRSINMPTVALVFLRGSQQARSAWTLDGRKKINGRDVAELGFSEIAVPRVIGTIDDAAATGRFWVEPDSGRVVRSELTVESAGMHGAVTVTFGPAPGIVPFVPLSMDDQYRLSGGARSAIDAHATYKNFRTFNVEANSVIKK